jgi:hypothetical protein
MTKYLLVFCPFLVACIPDLSVEIPLEDTSCDPEPQTALVDAFPFCDLGMCGPDEQHRARGRCVDDNQLGESQLAMLEACANGYSHCVPVPLLLSDGRAQPPVCTSIRGAEGRCLSICIPDIAAKASQLPVDICGDGELCAPCYDPVTGESTEACETSTCDAPVEPPQTFERCCEDRAVCVPSTIVPESQRGQLEQKTCAEDDDLCAPLENTDPTYEAPHCTGAIGQEGRCLSTCIPNVNTFGSVQPECPANTKCMACNIIIGIPSGACE